MPAYLCGEWREDSMIVMVDHVDIVDFVCMADHVDMVDDVSRHGCPLIIMLSLPAWMRGLRG